MNFTDSLRDQEIGIFIDGQLGLGRASQYWTWSNFKRTFDYCRFYKENFETAQQWVLLFEHHFLIYQVKRITFRNTFLRTI